MGQKIRVGVFPLRDIILFPNTVLPLIIQESSYIQMIHDSLEEGFPLAVGLGDPVIGPDGRINHRLLRPRAVLGLGSAQIVDTFPDGSRYVLFTGIGRVSLGEVVFNVPYLKCEAETLSELPEKSLSLSHTPLHRLESILTSWIDRFITDPEQRHVLMQNIKTPAQVIDYLAMFLIKDRELKQIYLETNTMVEKINLLDMLLTGERPKKENVFHGNIIKGFEFFENLTGTVH